MRRVLGGFRRGRRHGKSSSSEGGNGDGGGESVADHAHGMQERELVGVLVGFQRGLVDQAADGEVAHHQAVKLLPHEVRGRAAQDDCGASQMGLKLVERRLDFPALVVEGGQLLSRRLVVLENAGDQYLVPSLSQ